LVALQRYAGRYATLWQPDGWLRRWLLHVN